MELSVDRAAEYEQRVIRDAVEIGSDRLRCVLMSTANWLMIAASQLESSHAYPDTAEKVAAKSLAELVIESLSMELPTRPLDLLSEVDPDDLIKDDERFTAAVHSRLQEVLRGVRL